MHQATEQIPEEDVQAAAQRVNGILHAEAAKKEGYVNIDMDGTMTYVKPRKPRSDKGLPKPKKEAAAPAGALTQAQMRELDARVVSMIRTREEMQAAIAASDKAQKYYADYLDQLQGK